LRLLRCVRCVMLETGLEPASATAAVVPAAAVPPAVVPPAVAFVPVGVAYRVPLAAGVPVVALPPPPPVVDSDSENEMAESQFNTQFAPQKFKGLINENAKDWIRQFENYCHCQYKEFNADKKMALFKVLLVDSAAVWYDSLSEDNTDTWAHVKMAFETSYNPPNFMKYQHANDLFNKKQGDMSVDDFCAKMQRLANDVGADDLMLRFAVINGLNPEIRNHVTRAQPNTWTDLVQQAKVGKMCIPVVQPLNTTLAVKLEVIQDQLKQLTAEKAKPRSVSPVCSAGRSDRRDSSQIWARPWFTWFPGSRFFPGSTKLQLAKLCDTRFPASIWPTKLSDDWPADLYPTTSQYGDGTKCWTDLD